MSVTSLVGLRPMSRLLVRTATSFSLVLSAAVLAAGGTTTLGTRALTSVESAPITDNAGAAWTRYARDIDYPKSATLPLQYIDTRDGEKLAVVVSVPADDDGNPVPGRFPVVLTQGVYRVDLSGLLGELLPSQTTLLIGGEDKYMVRRGYISVTVDVRGAGMSTGISELIGEAEQAAYYDTVDWVAQQPWFDGNLGLAGTSYLGITTLLTAAQQHPAVKAAFAEVPMGDPYRGTVVTGGLLNAEFINLWLTLTHTLSVTNDLALINYPEYADIINQATQDHIDALDAWYLPLIDNGLANAEGVATDDGDFWAVRSPLEKARDINVPTFVIGATNDIFQRAEPLLYEQLKRNVNSKLVILPGSHIGSIIDAAVGHYSQGGAPGSQELLLRWFDHYLKGIDTGAEQLPNVTQYVEGYGTFGQDRFATTTDWPHPKAEAKRYYFRSNKSLTSSKPWFFEWSSDVEEPSAPTVSVSKSDSGKTVNGSVDIEDDSVCSRSGVQWSLGINGLLPLPCHNDNSIVEGRQDAVVYETAPQWRDMYINGPMQADIWMSSNRPHAALAVRVSVVDAFGKATPVAAGLQSAAFRAVDESRSRYLDGEMIQPWHPFTAASLQPLRNGEPVLVPVEIFPAAVLIRAGQRLRVSVSASNQVQGVWPLPIQQMVEGGTTTIYNNSRYPSSVVVPVVPASELN